MIYNVINSALPSFPRPLQQQNRGPDSFCSGAPEPPQLHLSSRKPVGRLCSSFSPKVPVFLSNHSINTLRIPVGWWIASDPNPPAPFVGGSLKALDTAFTWALKHGLKGIIDLHAAPGYKMEMSTAEAEMAS